MRLFFKRKNPNQVIDPSRPKKPWKYFIWGLVILVLGVLAWIGVTGYIAYRNISTKNASDSPLFFKDGTNISPDQLGAEGDSRINVLLIGVDKAAGLTDTLQIVSFDPINNTYAMMSIPRDLAVNNPGLGPTKINAVYNGATKICVSLKSCPSGVDQGAYVLERTINEVTGVKIHYYVKTDFSGLKSIVDSIGGIDVYVDKQLYDTQFPAEVGEGYVTVNIKAGQQHMNGDTALKYSRSRHSTSDFDRARRQQIVVNAIKDKIMTLGTLSNPQKVTSLLNSLGQHLKTDISLSDVTKFATLVKAVDSHKTASEVLDTSADGPLRDATDSSLGYIIYPRLGINNYTEVKDYVLTIFQEPYVLKEKARVTIINATGKTANGTTIMNKLKGMGYNVVSTTDATKSQTATTITDSSNDPYTLKLLKKRFNASSLSKATRSDADIVLTIGTSYKIN